MYPVHVKRQSLKRPVYAILVSIKAVIQLTHLRDPGRGCVMLAGETVIAKMLVAPQHMVKLNHRNCQQEHSKSQFRQSFKSQNGVHCTIKRTAFVDSWHGKDE